MEIAGLVVGGVSLAGLTSVTRDAHNTISAYQQADLQSQPFAIRRDAAPLSLQRWRERVGLRPDGCLERDHHKNLDDAQIRGVVDDILQYFNDTGVETNSSSAVKATATVPPQHGSRRSAKPSANNTHRAPLSRKSKTSWAWQGKTKATDEAQNTDALLQILQSLTPSESHSDRAGLSEPGTSSQTSPSRNFCIRAYLANIGGQSRHLIVDLGRPNERCPRPGSSHRNSTEER